MYIYCTTPAQTGSETRCFRLQTETNTPPKKWVNTKTICLLLREFITPHCCINLWASWLVRLYLIHTHLIKTLIKKGLILSGVLPQFVHANAFGAFVPLKYFPVCRNLLSFYAPYVELPVILIISIFLLPISNLCKTQRPSFSLKYISVFVRYPRPLCMDHCLTNVSPFDLQQELFSYLVVLFKDGKLCGEKSKWIKRPEDVWKKSCHWDINTNTQTYTMSKSNWVTLCAATEG